MTFYCVALMAPYPLGKVREMLFAPIYLAWLFRFYFDMHLDGKCSTKFNWMVHSAACRSSSDEVLFCPIKLYRANFFEFKQFIFWNYINVLILGVDKFVVLMGCLFTFYLLVLTR